jgi:hypothetical protein
MIFLKSGALKKALVMPPGADCEFSEDSEFTFFPFANNKKVPFLKI